MHTRRILPLLGLASALVFSGRAHSQTAGALQQASNGNPFAAMLEGKGTISSNINASISNNTFDIGDVAAIIEILDDFKPSDAFLIGGKAPPGEGALLRARSEAGLFIGFPLSFGMVGVSAGVRVHAQGALPEAVSRILRDGSSSNNLVVDLNGLGGRGIAYGNLGLLTLINLFEDAENETRVRLGIGAHYLYSLAGGELLFDGSAFADNSTSRVTLTSTAVEANLKLTYPRGTGTVGGRGFAGDVFLAANLGKLYLGGLLRGFGSIEHTGSELGLVNLVFTAGGIGELIDVLDTLSTETVPGITESTALPATLRLEGSYQFNAFLGLGVLWEKGFRGPFEVGSSVIGVVEVRLAPWLPIRVGGSRLQGLGNGFSGGLGLDFDTFELTLDLTAQGGVGDKSESAILRTGFAFFF